jgi:ATP synthase protein I
MNVSDQSPEKHLEDLNYRLIRAREKSHANKQMPSIIGKEQTRGFSMAIRVGTELVAALVVSVGIGHFLDYWLDTKPWFLVVFFFLGAGAGVLNVYRAASGLGLAVGYREPSGGVSSLVKRQKTPTRDIYKEKKGIGDK